MLLWKKKRKGRKKISKQMTVKKVLFVLLAVIVLQILITPNTVEAISPSTYRLRVQNLVYTDKGLQAEYVIKEGNVPIADILIKEKGGTIVNLPKGEYTLEVVKDPEGWKTVAEAGVISKFSLPYIQSGKAYGDLTITAKATEVKEKFNLKVQTVFYEKGGKPVPVPGVTYTLVDRNTGDYSIILKTGLVTND